MLVLTRKINERIVIEGGIVITIVRIENNQVKVGVDAPKDIRIDREEIHVKRLETTLKEKG